MLTNSAPVEIFCSYAHEDELLCQQIENHLSLLSKQGLLTLWHNRLLLPGTDWAQATDTHLETASIVLLLISASFFASDYCYSVELQRALQRHKASEARVVPILLRAVDWKITPLAHLQVLPTNAKPVTSWSNQDEALTDVVAGLRRIIADIPLLSSSIPRTALPEIWNIPYPRNPFFLGRDELLLHLHSSLLAGQTIALSQPKAISGLGGIGKTQIAVEYAYRFRQKYETVLWGRAESREALFSSYTEFASLLHLPEYGVRESERIVKAVNTWLQRHRKWLLVLDNVDDLDLIPAFLPSTFNGHQLLTTRAQDMQRLAQRFEVNVLPPEQGALFLLRRAGLLPPDAPLEQASSEEQTLAFQLVAQMGGLPLALDQAGAYLEATAMPLEEYSRVYQRYRQALHQQRRTRILDHPEPVATTWTLAFQQVERHNPAAAELLRLCAFLAPDDIPEEMITQGALHLGKHLEATVTDPFQMSQAVEALRYHSLVGRNPRTKTLSMHRLVQVILRDSMDAGTAQSWLERATKVVVGALTEGKYENWDIYVKRDQSQQVYNQVETCIELLHEYSASFPEMITLLDWAGFYLSQHGRHQEAQTWIEQALQLSEHIYGTEHLETGQAMYSLAWLYRRMEKYTEAEPLFLRTLRICEQQLEPEHPDTATVLNVLAFLYMDQKRYREAEPLFLHALRIYEQQLGPEHPETAQCLSNLGLFYTYQNDYNQAEQFTRQSLTIREQIFGLDHPATAQSLHNLAFLYQKQEKYAEAESLYLRSLAIYKKMMTQEHPYTQKVLKNYLSLLQAMGRDGEAKTLEESS